MGRSRFRDKETRKDRDNMGSVHGWEVFAAIIYAVIVVWAICVVIGIVLYILFSIALSRGLAACGYGEPWMAWIPVARKYALADCAVHGMDRVYLWDVPFPGWLFRFHWAICGILMFIPYGGWVLAVGLRIFAEGPCYAAMYAAVEGTAPGEKLLVGYLSAVIPVIPIVKLWNAGRGARCR